MSEATPDLTCAGLAKLGLVAQCRNAGRVRKVWASVALARSPLPAAQTGRARRRCVRPWRRRPGCDRWRQAGDRRGDAAGRLLCADDRRGSVCWRCFGGRRVRGRGEGGRGQRWAVCRGCAGTSTRSAGAIALVDVHGPRHQLGDPPPVDLTAVRQAIRIDMLAGSSDSSEASKLAIELIRRSTSSRLSR